MCVQFYSHDFIGEFSTSYREMSRSQSQFHIYEVKVSLTDAHTNMLHTVFIVNIYIRLCIHFFKIILPCAREVKILIL